MMRRKNLEDRDLILSSFFLRKFAPSQTLEAGFKMNKFMIELMLKTIQKKKKLKYIKKMFELIE